MCVWGGWVWCWREGAREESECNIKRKYDEEREREWHTQDPMLYHYGLGNMSKKMTECFREGK